MFLTGPDRARLELRVLGYELPDADPADDEWDANWLVLSGRGSSPSSCTEGRHTWGAASLASDLRAHPVR